METPSNKGQSFSHTSKAEPSSSVVTATLDTDHTHPSPDHAHTDTERHVTTTPTTPPDPDTTTPGMGHSDSVGESSKQAVTDEGGVSSSTITEGEGGTQRVRSDVKGQSSVVAKETAKVEEVKRKRKRDSDEGECCMF